MGLQPKMNEIDNKKEDGGLSPNIEQQIGFILETEEIIEKLELRQLFREVEDSFAKAKRTGNLHDWIVAQFWFDKFDKEHARIYGEHPDEEEEIIKSMDGNKDVIRIPKEWTELRRKDDNPYNSFGSIS